MIKKRLKVSEVKELEPLADVYEFKKLNLYLILVNKPKIQLIGGSSPIKNAEGLAKKLQEFGIASLIVALDDKDELKILKLEA